MKLKRNIIFLATYLTFNFLISQTPSYLQYTMEDGLPSNHGNFITQDQEGFMWIATDNGLSRFDGERFKNYGLDKGLPDTEVLKVFEDIYGRLWVSTFLQKPAYKQKNKFHSDVLFKELPDVNLQYINYDFLNGPDSSLWITSGSMIHLAGKNIQDIKVSIVDNFKPRFIREFLNGFLAVRGYDLFFTNLHSKDPIFKKLFSFPIKTKYHSIAASKNYILISFLNPTKTILLKFENGKIHVVAEQQKTYEFLYADRTGKFWASHAGLGVFCFDMKNEDFKHHLLFLRGKKVSSIFEDRRGNFWFSSIDEGIFCLPKNHALSWTKAEGLLSNNIISIVQKGPDSLLIGDDTGNVYSIYNSKIRIFKKFGSIDGTNLVRGIMVEDGKNFHIATDEGCYVSKENTVRLTPKNACKALIFDNDNYWLGTSAGIYQKSIKGDKFVLRNKGRVTTLGADWEGNIWKGNTEGLFNSSEQFKFNWGNIFPLLNRRIVNILPADNHKLWITTSAGHLLLASTFKGKIQKLENLSHLLPSGLTKINRLLISKEGLWLATNLGVFLIDKNNILTNYSVKQGLGNYEANDLLIEKGNVWIATDNGLYRLISNPKFVAKSDEALTKLVELEYSINHRDIIHEFISNQNSSIDFTLAADAKLKEIKFTTLNCFPCEPHIFQHSIELKPLPFFYSSIQNIIAVLFTQQDSIRQNGAILNFEFNLVPGNYSFQTASLSSNGKELAKPLIWQLTVLPHWTQTIWPWLLIAICALSLIRRYYSITTQNMMLKTVSLQFNLKALSSQINPHFIGNSINALQSFFYPPDPIKASEYISIFTKLLRQTMEQVTNDFNKLNIEIKYITDYLVMVQLRYTDLFDFKVTINDNVDTNLPFPTMLLQPIVENATIHGLAKKEKSILHIYFYKKKDSIFCEISDNGEGIFQSMAKKRKHTHIHHNSMGINLLKDKIKLLNRLYPIKLNIEWKEIQKTEFDQIIGTQVIISYSSKSINPSKFSNKYFKL